MRIDPVFNFGEFDALELSSGQDPLMPTVFGTPEHIDQSIQERLDELLVQATAFAESDWAADIAVAEQNMMDVAAESMASNVDIVSDVFSDFGSDFGNDFSNDFGCGSGCDLGF